MIKWVGIMCAFEPVYIIVTIFRIKHGYITLDDHFKLIQDDLDVYMKWA